MTGTNYTSIDTIPSIVNTLRMQFNTGKKNPYLAFNWIMSIYTHFSLGLTKDIQFRKEQLKNLIRFCNENNDALCKALWSDLRKHAMECDVGEISPIVDECQFMIKNLDKFCKPVHTSKRFLMNAADKTYVRKEAKGVVLVLGAWNYPVS